MVVVITVSPLSLVTQSKFSLTFIKVKWEAVKLNYCMQISYVRGCLKKDVQNLLKINKLASGGDHCVIVHKRVTARDKKRTASMIHVNPDGFSQDTKTMAIREVVHVTVFPVFSCVLPLLSFKVLVQINTPG